MVSQKVACVALGELGSFHLLADAVENIVVELLTNLQMHCP